MLISAPNGIQETCAHPNVVGLFTLLSEDAKQLKPASVPTEARCAHETCLAAQLAAELAWSFHCDCRVLVMFKSFDFRTEANSNLEIETDNGGTLKGPSSVNESILE